MEIILIISFFAYTIWCLGQIVTDYRETDEELRSKYKYPYCKKCGDKIRRQDFYLCADCHKW